MNFAEWSVVKYYFKKYEQKKRRDVFLLIKNAVGCLIFSNIYYTYEGGLKGSWAENINNDVIFAVVDYFDQ